MKKVVFSLVSIIVTTFMVGCGGSIGDLAQNAIYPSATVNKTPVPEFPPAPLQQNYLDINVAEQSYKLHLWYFAQAQANRPVVIYFHGNGENLATVYKSGMFAKLANSVGAHVVAIDYPSYGRTTGKANQATLTTGAAATIDWVSKTFPQSQIYILGWSLGAAVGSQMAAHEAVDKFILMSPWSTLRDLAEKLFSALVPMVPKEFFESNVWDSVEVASRVDIPGYVFHGTDDKTIPFEFGQKVHAAHDQTKVKFIPMQGRVHNDIFQDEKFWSVAIDFFGK
jgi:pimeloyl-ACP methyl ester carboxylesterase